MIMLVAPWARLNTRVVVYVSTSPDAATAYAAPKNSPVIVYETNMSTSADPAVDQAAAGVGVRRLAYPLAAGPLDHRHAVGRPFPGHVVRRAHVVVRPAVHLAQFGQHRRAGQLAPQLHRELGEQRGGRPRIRAVERRRPAGRALQPAQVGGQL